jgi:hypothetical protein
MQSSGDASDDRKSSSSPSANVELPANPGFMDELNA